MRVIDLGLNFLAPKLKKDLSRSFFNLVYIERSLSTFVAFALAITLTS